MQLSTCIEWQFAEADDTLEDRVRAAKAADCDHIASHLWHNKGMAGLAAALDETGVALSGFCVDPRRSIVDRTHHEKIQQAVADALAIASTIGSPPLIVASSYLLENFSEAQHKAEAVKVLRRVADLAEVAEVTLILDPLNDGVEHPGMYQVDTALALDIVQAVGSPRLKLFYDVYQSHVLGENMRSVLDGRMHVVEHFQVGDSTGRDGPATGTIDWSSFFPSLDKLGYTGARAFGYRPSMDAATSLSASREVLSV